MSAWLLDRHARRVILALMIVWAVCLAAIVAMIVADPSRLA